MVQRASDNGNERATFLLQNDFEINYKRNLAKIVVYYQEFNYQEIYETGKYTVSRDQISSKDNIQNLKELGTVKMRSMITYCIQHCDYWCRAHIIVLTHKR